MQPTKVILLACGSFNPITNMHLRMFELARDFLNRTGRFTVVEGIISPVSDGYAKKGLITATHRCAMVTRALQSSTWIRMDKWESDQSQWTRTARALGHFKREVDQAPVITERPSKKRRLSPKGKEGSSPVKLSSSPPDAPCIKLLCGADLLESFSVPGLWSEEDMEYIVSQHGLVCITRSDFNPQKFIYESDLLTKYQDNIHLVTEWIYNDISSTKIRRALTRNESVKYLVQDSVIDYITENSLYGYVDNKLVNHITPSPTTDTPDNAVESSKSSPAKVAVIGTHYAFMYADSFTETENVKESPRHTPSEVKTASTQYSVAYTNASTVTNNSPMKSTKSVKAVAVQCSIASPLNSCKITSSPKSPKSSLVCVCGANDINGLLKRMKNARIAWTTETCV